VAGRKQQLALLPVQLRRVEALTAPLHGAQRLGENVEGGRGLAGFREGRGQQAEEVRPEVLRAQRAKSPASARAQPPVTAAQAWSWTNPRSRASTAAASARSRVVRQSPRN
jgi:hypothetical protein